MKLKKIVADALRDAGEWVDGTFIYRHVAAAEICQPVRPPVYQGPTIDPIRHIAPGEIVEWVKDKSGGNARYPLPEQSTYAPGLFARPGAGLL